MQVINEEKLKRSIRIKNKNSYVRGIVDLKFLLFLVVGIVIGGGFFHSSYVDRSAVDFGIIYGHFSGIFVGCETFSEKLMTVLVVSEMDIGYLFLIFISGFTYFCSIASGLMMLGRGFMLGIASSCLIYASKGLTDLGAATMLYTVFSVISVLILISLSTSAYIFSFDFSTIKRNRYVLRRAPIIYKYSFSLILSLGGLIINNFLYCICFYQM